MQLKEIIHGFEVRRKQYVQELEGEVYELEHLGSGAQMIVVDNQDEKKAFLVGFRTIPEDSTGVFHILEHCVLNGSRKYPDKDTFVNLMKHSMAEFVNAITYPDHTVYPFCTANEKDFMNLMDIYLDAVFFPNVLMNREIFEQEGWHFQCEQGNNRPEINGVVYNEMKGVCSSLDNMLMYEINEAMFPEHTYRFVAGGSPEAIPSLSYEKFLKMYRTYYSTSNCCMVLYGKMNLEEKLAFIDKEYLSRMKRAEKQHGIPKQRPVHARRRKEYDRETFGDQGVFAAFTYHLGCFEEREKMTAVYILFQALMGENEAPLKKELLQSLHLPDIRYFVMDGIGQPYLAITIKNAKKDTAEQLGKILREKVEIFCKEGINEKILVSALNRQEFWNREKGGYRPDGIEYALDLVCAWVQGTDPVKILEFEEIYKKLREKMKEGYFEKLLQEIILDNTYQAEVVVEPGSENYAEDEEYVQTAQSRCHGLSLEDLEKESVNVDSQIIEYGNVGYLKHNIHTKGIVYQSFYFDLSDLEPEKVPYAKILSELLGELPAGTNSFEEILIEKNTWLGNINFYLETYTRKTEAEKASLKFVIDVSALEENLEKCVELTEIILYKTLLHNPEVIQTKLQQIRMNMEQGFVMSGDSFASLRASAHYMMEGVLRERYNGISFYQFISELLEHFDDRCGELIDILEEIKEKICQKAPLVIGYTGTASSFDKFKKMVKSSHISSESRSQEAEYYKDDFLAGHSEAFIIPSQVSYVALGGNGNYTGEDYLLGRMVSYDYLWSKVRVEGGAYGCFMTVSPNGSWMMSSYRDPNVKTTCDVFRGAASWLKELQTDPQTLLNYKIGAVARYDRIPKAYAQAKQMDAWYLRQEEKETRENVREQILWATETELKNRRKALEQFSEKGTICVLGNKTKIEEASEEFDSITVLIE